MVASSTAACVMDHTQSLKLWSFTDYYQETINSHRFLNTNIMFIYHNDIVIYSSSLVEYQTKFNKITEQLRQANLKRQPDRYEFLRKKK